MISGILKPGMYTVLGDKTVMVVEVVVLGRGKERVREIHRTLKEQLLHFQNKPSLKASGGSGQLILGGLDEFLFQLALHQCLKAF